MQKEFFDILDEFFQRATGKPAAKFATPDTFSETIRKGAHKIARRSRDAFPKGIEALVSYYSSCGMEPFKQAQSYGGMKLVLGGSSRFEASHLQAVKKMLLYADTIFIPDPVLPWLEIERTEEKFQHVHLLYSIFMLLHLKPIAEADLTYPAIFIFPSYEKRLENQDEETKIGIENLMINFFMYYMKRSFESAQDVIEYVRISGEEFLRQVESSNLFIPPAGTSGISISENIEHYKNEIRTWRSEEYVNRCDSLTAAELTWMGIFERLAPQWHLLENADELNSQPMLCVDAHWHYYRLCTRMFEGRLLSADLLEPSTVNTLRALSTSQFEWLGNIPIEVLAKLREQNENEEFRKKIAEFTSKLHDTTIENLNRVAAEVGRGIASLLSEHKKKVHEINEKYARLYAKTLTAGIISLGPTFLPSLAPFMQAITPMALAGKYTWDKTGEIMEKRKLSRSLMGVLATAKENRT